MKHLIPFGLAVVLLSTTTLQAAPAGTTCRRWTPRAITVCEAVGLSAGCTLEGLAAEQSNQKYYNGSAKAACALQMSKLGLSPWEMWPVDGDPYNDTLEGTIWDYDQARCMWDFDGDGDIDEDDLSGAKWVDLGSVAIDPHCFCRVTNPPYADVEWSWDGVPLFFKVLQITRAYFEHRFPSPLKKAILEKNIDKHGSLASDAPFDPDQQLQKVNMAEGDAAEIDHIIPRVDSHGCLCGDVTPDNAAVISRGLNWGMSNTSPSWDPNRAKMYEEFGVVCDDPSAGTYKGTSRALCLPPAPEYADLDETTVDVALEKEELPPIPLERTAPTDLDDEASGCSTSRGSAGVVMLLAIVAACLRRRR